MYMNTGEWTSDSESAWKTMSDTKLNQTVMFMLYCQYFACNGLVWSDIEIPIPDLESAQKLSHDDI